MSGQASAPASSANLGPGFDCIALALELRCKVTAEPSDAWLLVEGGTASPGEEDDLVVRAVRMAVGRSMRLTISSDIPASRGLGSSAAVTTAAAVAAMRAVDMPVDVEKLFRIICELEGHTDNAAAAVFGGLVLMESSGVRRHIDLSPKLGIVVAIPNHQLPTEEARAWLPPVVNLKAATRNLARFGFLLEGLRTGDSDALRFAAGDEMHEPFRAALAPFTDELMMAAQRAGAFHTCWSGAGPSVLAFCNVGRVEVVSMALSGQLGDNGTVMVLEPTADGFR